MRNSLFVVIAGAGLLSACGGGGSAYLAPVEPPSSSATVALSGTAAKGLMANADVDVLAVKADGTVDTGTALAHTTTSPAGSYSLRFAGTKDQPYVVRVSANAGTTHFDEVSNASQPLPLGFVMRSLVTPTAAGAVSASSSVTPFSEMAVAAAAKASGGLTAANAAQAVSAVSQLLGFDPSTVAAKSVADASGVNEQKLAVLLTAVSQLAGSGGLGCASGSAGDKAKCVVDALAAAANKDSIKLGNASDDVSAKLAAAVATVLTSDAVRARVDAAVLTTVVANLGCTDCSAAAAGSTPAAPSATATAIAAAKLLFGQIKTDWAAMFSRGGSTAIAGGAVNQEAFKFKSVMDNAKVPADMLVKDLGALVTAVDLYNDFKSSRSTANTRSRGDTDRVTKGALSAADASSPVGCGLYVANTGSGALATVGDTVGSIGCSARYYITSSGAGVNFVSTTWRHGFVIVPDASGGYNYQSRARRSGTTCSGSPLRCSQTSNDNLLADASNADPTFDGSFTPVLSAAFGDIQSFTLAGKLPPAFTPGGTTLVGRSNTVSMTGTQTVAAVGDVLSTLQASLLTQDGNGATLSTLTVKPGSSLANSPVSVDANGHDVAPGSATAVRTAGGHLSALTLDLVFGVPTAEFEGVLSMTDAVWDKSGTSFSPTKASLSGALRNTSTSGASSTEFLKGVFTATATGYGAFDATQPRTVANSFQLSASFVGTLTASNRPALEFTLASTANAADLEAKAAKQLTLQYRTLVAGVPRTVVALTADLLANGDYAVKLTEATSKLSLAWTGNPATVDLLVNDSSKIGSLATGNGLLTFIDGSFMSLDIGL